jgi:hypothetical protein
MAKKKKVVTAKGETIRTPQGKKLAERRRKRSPAQKKRHGPEKIGDVVGKPRGARTVATTRTTPRQRPSTARAGTLKRASDLGATVLTAGFIGTPLHQKFKKRRAQRPTSARGTTTRTTTRRKK